MHRPGLSKERRATLVVAVVALAALASCGGDDDAGSLADDVGGATDTTVEQDVGVGSDGDAGDGADGAAVDVSAQLELDGRTRLFDDGECSILPDLDLIEGHFTNDDGDELSLTSSAGVVRVSMTLDGEQWVDVGDDTEATADGSTAVWSGGTAIVDEGENPFDTTITLHC